MVAKPDIQTPSLSMDFSRMSTLKVVNYLVVHHSGDEADLDAKRINTIHRDHNGWAGIGYHFVIKKDGTIEQGRPRDKVGAHAKPVNKESLGICVVGNFEKVQLRPAQRESLIALLKWLKSLYPEAKLAKHNDFSATACPGKNFPFAEIVKAVEQPELPAIPPRPGDDYLLYPVVKGDALSRIASRFGTNWQHLAEVNQLPDPDRIEINQLLWVPVPGAAAEKKIALLETELAKLNAQLSNKMAECNELVADLKRAAGILNKHLI